jgi:hypothetical protein
MLVAVEVEEMREGQSTQQEVVEDPELIVEMEHQEHMLLVVVVGDLCLLTLEVTVVPES